MDCNKNKCTFNAPSNIMMQVNMCNCTINSMQMMNLGEEEGPPTVNLYKIMVVSPDGSESFNIRIDRTQPEVRLILTKEETDIIWQIVGDLNNNETIAIGTPGGTEFWTAIPGSSAIAFRPLGMNGNPMQFYSLTELSGNQFSMQRPGDGPNDPAKSIGTDELPEEGQIILSDGEFTIFSFMQIMPV